MSVEMRMRTHRQTPHVTVPHASHEHEAKTAQSKDTRPPTHKIKGSYRSHL